jgi:hypothetical protein
MCTVHRKQNTSQTVHQKCVLCTETEHFPDCRSEMCIAHRNRTHSKQYVINEFCAQKQNPFQMVHHKCVLCTETEHFLNGTHKAEFIDQKTTFKDETKRLTVIQIHQHMQLTQNKSHTLATHNRYRGYYKEKMYLERITHLNIQNQHLPLLVM